MLNTVAFLMDDCDEPIPEWFYVAVGVFSEDFPLYISRETLLQNTTLRVLVKMCFEMFAEMPRRWTTPVLYEQFGKRSACLAVVLAVLQRQVPMFSARRRVSTDAVH